MRKLSRLARSVTGLYLLFVLQSCATVPGPLAEPIMANAEPSTELDSLIEGDEALFYGGLLAPLGQVTIGRQYLAASGRRCKQVLDEFGIELIAVACQANQDQWYLRKSS